MDRALRAQSLVSRMLLQVHDGMVFEVAPGELEALKTLATERRMCGAFELTVPLAVSFGTGRTWEDAGH